MPSKAGDHLVRDAKAHSAGTGRRGFLETLRRRSVLFGLEQHGGNLARFAAGKLRAALQVTFFEGPAVDLGAAAMTPTSRNCHPRSGWPRIWQPIGGRITDPPQTDLPHSEANPPLAEP